MPRMRCLIVTPTYNSEAYLEETIASVVMQVAPEVDLRYHVQDGGSTDRTIAILQDWSRRMADPNFPKFSKNLTFSFHSEPDGGMYAALNKGFTLLGPHEDDILTWINSDDRLGQGAVATIQQVFSDNPDCQFASGRTALLNEQGAIVSISYPQAFSRASLAAGLHDGRTFPFVMQEGTFFTGALWLKVGGVDASFRLAGDWDLWRRMARQTNHFSVDTITASHRRRSGQLSEDIDKYLAEVDERPAESTDQRELLSDSAQLIRFDAEKKRWTSLPFDPVNRRPPAAVVNGVRRTSCLVRFREGLGSPEGPYPEHHLPSGIRWMTGAHCRIEIHAPFESLYRFRLVIRPIERDVSLSVHVNANELQVLTLPDPLPQVSQLIEFAAWLHAGVNTLKIALRDAREMSRRLLLISCDAFSEPTPERLLPALGWPVEHSLAARLDATAVVVHARDDPTRLTETVASILEHCGERASILVRVRCDSLSARAVCTLAPQIALIEADGDEAQDVLDHRLLASGFRYVLDLAEGDLLAGGALEKLQRALAESGAVAVGGLTEIRDEASCPVAQLLPVKGNGAALRILGETPPGLRDDCIRTAIPVISRVGSTPDELLQYLRPPTVWLLDAGSPSDFPPNPMLMLAAALTTLGVDARHVRLSQTGSDLAACLGIVAGNELMISSALAHPHDAALGVQHEGGNLLLRSLRGEPGTTISIPVPVDAGALRSRSRRLARRRLALAADGLIVIMSASDHEVFHGSLVALEKSGVSIARCLLLGTDKGNTDLESDFVTRIPWPEDLAVLSYYLSASDVALCVDRSGSLLVSAACSCAIPVLDEVGHIFLPDGPAESAGADLLSALQLIARNSAAVRQYGARGRTAVELDWSIEATATALQNGASQLAILPRLSAWLEQRAWLGTGDITVSTGIFRGLDVQSSRGPGDCALHIERGAVAIADPRWPGAFRLDAGYAVLLLRVENISGDAIRVHVRAPLDSTWSITLDEAPAQEFRVMKPGILTIVVSGPIGPGLHRMQLQAADSRTPRLADQALSVLTWEVISSQNQIPSSPKRSRVIPAPLSGRLAKEPRKDGEWRSLDGFLIPEGPHPAAGLYQVFQWSTGPTCSILLFSERSGKRLLDLAFCGITPDLRIRPIVNGMTYDWCVPIDAVVGRIHHRQWLLDWHSGDVEVTFELSGEKVLSNKRDLGILLLQVQLSQSG